MTSNSLSDALQEYLGFIDRGEEPDLEELLRKYPEHESDLLAHINREKLLLGGVFQGPRIPDFDLGSLLSRGDRLADYEILNAISSTTMGDVYRARQISLDRIVALKVMRPRGGNWSSRFKNESHLAATLHHNNIVTVFDSGIERGFCFYSMEFIEGDNLDGWHSANRRDWKATAKVMEKAALAVQHAHDQEVLHRDLKPSNILVDRNNEPQVTDFGLAKSLLSDVDMTSPSEVLGTPSFIAPEQIDGQKDSKLSDVYGLGATLYALLTGEPPFRGRTPAETLQQVLQKPLTEPRLIDSQVPTDLETICLKCMDRAPEYRYQSAAELAADLQRFCEGMPIKAKPIGFLGSTIRLVRRNRLTSLLLTIVGIGLLSSPLLAFYLNQQRKLAKQGQNQATKSAAELKHVSDFMQSVWHSADPYINGKDLLASELLDDAVLQANDKFQDNPRVLADVSLALGANYHELGFADKAVDVLEKSVDCYAQADGPESKKTLLANSRLAVALLYASKAEDAKTLIQSTAETWLSRFPLDDDYDEIEDARITILMEVDEYSNAIELRRESIERIAVRDGEDSKNVRSQQLQLALALIEKEEFKEAEVLVSKVIQLCDQDQATQESLYADALGLMGRVRREQENYEKAIEYHQQALDIQVELLGEDHWESLRRMESLSLSMIGAKKHDDAIQMLRRRADAASSRYGKSHRESVTAEIKILRFEGDPLKRIDGFESLLPRMLEAFPADHSQVLAAKQNAAQAYTYAGNPVEAAKILREIAPVVANVYGPFHRNTLRTQLVLADAICNAESAEAAVTFLESVYDGHLQELGPKHPSSVDLLCNMANYAFRGRLLDRAERWADKAIASCDHLDQPQLAFRRADMLLVLAESKLAKKEYDSAIENAMASHSIFSRPGRPNVFLAHAEALSSVAHLKSGNVDKTRKSVENAEAILKSLPEIHSEAWRRARAKELLSHCSAPLPEKNSQEIQNP